MNSNSFCLIFDLRSSSSAIFEDSVVVEAVVINLEALLFGDFIEVLRERWRDLGVGIDFLVVVVLIVEVVVEGVVVVVVVLLILIVLTLNLVRFGLVVVIPELESFKLKD